jgi:hypothetical protein
MTQGIYQQFSPDIWNLTTKEIVDSPIEDKISKLLMKIDF